MRIKKSRSLIALWIVLWSMLMVYIISRAPGNVVGVAEKMSDLVGVVKQKNGVVLSEDRFVKPGAMVQMALKFSSSGWSADVKTRNEKVFESIGAVDMSIPGKDIFCRGREQYEIRSPENSGFATYSIFMEYPGSICG
ncbi:hypothetical protein [Achromobacter ruhlandii]|uniref:hypothetical protein n=1 Tax=Achromobacter ruhlandii TaxID=72557 RepID=UPI001EED5BBB|nr:hypothetical protein [Achromobacter ruhlandii]